MWKNLLRCFPLVEAAGGLVQHANGKVLFIHRNNRWDLPKGRIEKGENEIDAAVREVIEETGVKRSDRKKTSSRYLSYFIKKQKVQAQKNLLVSYVYHL